jgi:hypothetical protein
MPFRGGDGGARQHHNHLPHVTPSPRVPALPAPRSASFALISHLHGFPNEREGGSAGRKPPSASRHSFPKSTCSAASWRPPSLIAGHRPDFEREAQRRDRKAHHLPHIPFPKSTCSACGRAAALLSIRIPPDGLPCSHRKNGILGTFIKKRGCMKVSGEASR